jgi:hypothetical protein
MDQYFYDPATGHLVAILLEYQCIAGPSDFEDRACQRQAVSCSDFDLSACAALDAGIPEAGRDS